MLEAVLGALGGTLVIILWEGWLKPQRDRESLANVLYVDVAINRAELASINEWVEEHGQVSAAEGSLHYSDAVLRATQDRLGLLPRSVVRDLLGHYREMERLSREFEYLLRRGGELSRRPPAAAKDSGVRLWKARRTLTGLQVQEAFEGSERLLERLASLARDLPE